MSALETESMGIRGSLTPKENHEQGGPSHGVISPCQTSLPGSDRSVDWRFPPSDSAREASNDIEGLAQRRKVHPSRGETRSDVTVSMPTNTRRTRSPLKGPKQWPSLAGMLATYCEAFLIFGLLWNPLGATAEATPSVVLAWDKSPTPGVIGYRVHYGATSGTYTNRVAVGNVTIATLFRRAFGRETSFVVTACHESGLERQFSNEARSMAYTPASIATDLSGVLTIRRMPGTKHELIATHDLIHWMVLGNVSPDSDGKQPFVDPSTGNCSMRIYRIRPGPCQSTP